MSLKNDALVVAGIGVAVLGVLWYAKNAIGDGLSYAGDALQQAAPYIDPTDPRNVVYQAVSAPFGGSLGGYLYDLLH